MATKSRQILKFFLLSCGVWIFLAMTPVSNVEAQGSEVVHVVQPGESLAQIAGYYGVNYLQLARYNGISNPNIVHVGQRLRIPTATAPTPAPMATPASASIAAPTPIQAEVAPTRQFSSPELQPIPTPTTVATQAPTRQVPTWACGAEISYSVRRGDSLYGISAYYGVSARTIIARNHLPSTLIYVGQRLIIPLPSCE